MSDHDKIRKMFEETQQKHAIKFLEYYNDLRLIVDKFQDDNKVTDQDMAGLLHSMGLAFAQRAL